MILSSALMNYTQGMYKLITHELQEKLFETSWLQMRASRGKDEQWNRILISWCQCWQDSNDGVFSYIWYTSQKVDSGSVDGQNQSTNSTHKWLISQTVSHYAVRPLSNLFVTHPRFSKVSLWISNGKINITFPAGYDIFFLCTLL